MNSLFLDSGSCVSTCTGSYPLYDQVNRKCVQSCPTYLVQTTPNCNYCTSGYKLPGANSCVGNCGSGYYHDDTNKFCGDCDNSCEECDGQYA